MPCRSSHCLLPVLSLIAVFVIPPTSAQAQLSFQAHTVRNAKDSSYVLAHGDFNGDGREDLIVSEISEDGATGSTLLYLSSGDGTYQTPVQLPSSITANEVAIGDFNGDGKLDLAYLSYSGTNSTYQMNVALGNGDGTFQAVKLGFTGNSQTANVGAFIAADLNHDGKTDLVLSVNANAGANPGVQIYLSNGDGTFTAGPRVQDAGTTNPSGGIFAGDFDGDGKTDIMTASSPSSNGSIIQLFFGDGAGHLSSPYTWTDPTGSFDSVSDVADTNNDGRSDIIIPAPTAIKPGGEQQLTGVRILHGTSSRTLTVQDVQTAGCPSLTQVADFNGDGLNDLITQESNAPCGSAQTTGNGAFSVLTGTASGGFGPEQLVYQNTAYEPSNSAFAIRSSVGTKPDFIFQGVQKPSSVTFPYTPPTQIVLLSNNSNGNFPACGLSGIAEGVQICNPGGTSSSPVKFSVAAAGPTPMRTAAVWVDGAKVAEQLTHAFSNYSFLDASVALAAGSHAITVYGTGWDNTVQKKSFTLTVNGSTGGSCVGPASPGINVCSPVNGSAISSPVTAFASGTVSGTFLRFEVWIDGVKKFTSFTTDGVHTSFPLAAGSHQFSFYAVNTAGSKWNKISTVTVR